MACPEDLPSAPSSAVDPLFALKVMEEAKEESVSVHWVFATRMLSRANDWGVEMMQNKESLNLTEKDAFGCGAGFMLPLLCLQGAIVVLSSGGKGKTYEEWLGSVGQQIPNVVVNSVKANIDLSVEALDQDRSGIRLVQKIEEIYKARDLPGPFLRGLKLCVEVYDSYFQYFSLPYFD